MHRTRPLLIGLVLTLACMLPAAWAQESSADDGASSGEVTVKCPWFGVGGMVRPGEWAGLRLAIKDSSDKPRDVLVRISMPDPDGDQVLYEGRITTNPGVELPLWFYVYLPSYYKQNDVLTVNCYAAVEETGAATATHAAFGVGRPLGNSRIAPRMVVSRGDGMLALAGSRPLGLRRYEGIAERPDVPTGHERTLIAPQLTADTLPDRWYGLRQFDVIVWNEPPPGGLGSDKAQAIREWVQRGGHLVVVLPRVGQTWTDEANNPLYDITPRVVVDRHEGVDLSVYRLLITKERARGPNGEPGLAMPKAEVLQTFHPIEGALAGEAVCVLNGIERDPGKGPEWLVARRYVGTGIVDLVGLDVGSSWMTAHALPDPETFWHRILGRRGELWTQAEFTGKRTIGSWRESPTSVDRDIGSEISMSGSAGAGVLMGLVVFAAYWFVAGPLGYAVLRRTGYGRHAWVVFVAVAAFFTALAWGGASAVRPAQLKAQHLSILDHVYSTTLGGAVERSRSWVSLLVPQYGEATVSVGDPATKGSSSFRNLLSPWESQAAGAGGFPDARGYRVDTRSPDQYTIPTRSTVKQFMVDWAGGSKLKMIRPLPAEGQDGTGAIRVVQADGKDVLRGVLTHDLPAPLEDVVIVWVKGESFYNEWWRSKLIPPALARGIAIALPNPWNPQDPLDLSTLPMALSGSSNMVSDLGAYLKSIGEKMGRSDQGETMGPEGNPWNRLIGAAFYPLLDPPEVDEDRTIQKPQRLVQRQFAHGMDLAAWCTQPCIIVIGQLTKAADACPAPLYVDTGGGFREVQTTGRTMVRWIYPLPANPPAYVPAVEDASSGQLPGERANEPDEKPPPAFSPVPRKKGKPL